MPKAPIGDLRIAILGLNYSPEKTGIAPYTAGLAQGLSEQGHKIEVMTGYPHYPNWRIDGEYRGSRMSETVGSVALQRFRHFVPANGSSAPGRALMEASFGARIASAKWAAPDVVVCVSPALVATGMAIARARSTVCRPAVGVWVQDLYSRGAIETGVVPRQAAGSVARLESRILRSADGVAVIHDRFKAHVTGVLRVPESRVTVIRNWTHIGSISADRKDVARRKFGWADDEIVAVHAGNMGVKQGLENIVRAARLAELRGARVRFVLLGDGHQRRELEELGQDISTLQFIRPLPDADYQSALGAADILLLNEAPAVSEMAVPSKITSYFASGRPVIAATDVDSISAGEIVASGGGCVVPPGNPEALLREVEMLGSDHERSRRLGLSGMAFRQEVLSRDAAMKRFGDWVVRLSSTRSR